MLRVWVTAAGCFIPESQCAGQVAATIDTVAKLHESLRFFRGCKVPKSLEDTQCISTISTSRAYQTRISAAAMDSPPYCRSAP